MHEEATSMSVPCSVAVSTSHNQNGTTAGPPLVSVVTGDVDLEVSQDHDVNVELEVPFSTTSTGGKSSVTGITPKPSRNTGDRGGPVYCRSGSSAYATRLLLSDGPNGAHARGFPYHVLRSGNSPYIYRERRGESPRNRKVLG
ncbi:hypothetical protein Trydic_g175 [Trypoxylus dichotomus]